MKALDQILTRLPAPMARWVHRLLSFGLGLLAAGLLHYVLFRIALPSKPFIYVAF